MNNTILFRFHFSSPLHISTVREDYDKSETVFHSDSLYAAIMQAWSVLGIDIPDYQNQNINFALSSLFPFYSSEQNATPLYFFPKPSGMFSKPDLKIHKKVKKIQYIESSLYFNLLSVKNVEIQESNIHGNFYLDPRKDKFDAKFIDSDVQIRNSVSRTGEEDTKIYYLDRLYFKEHCGLFCVAQFENEEIKNKVIAALKYLKDEGIGTDRHVGNGLFDLGIDEKFDIPTPKQSDKTGFYTNLSLFCPENKENLQEILSDDKISYQLIKRGGWITTEPYTTYRKKSVYMFAEGGIFKLNSDKNIETLGKTVNLKPEAEFLKVQHNIYRVGKSIFLPINI